MALSFERSEHFEAVDYYIQLRMLVDDNVQQNEDVSPFFRRQASGGRSVTGTNDICTTYLNTSDQVPRVGFPKSESVSYRSGTTSHSVDVT